MNKEQTGVLYVQFNMLRKENLEKFSEREGGGVEGYLFFQEGVGNLFSVIFNK